MEHTHRSRWQAWALLGLAGVLGTVIAGIGVWSLLSSTATFRPRPSIARPSAAIDAFVKREYTGYTVLESRADERDYSTGLPGARYLLRSRDGRFPATLEVGIFEATLTDLDPKLWENLLEVDEFVTDDATFSATARASNHLTDTDLATMGVRFRTGEFGADTVISCASYDSEYYGITFMAAADAPAHPSLEPTGPDVTHVVQIYRDGPTDPWAPMEFSPIEE